MIRFWLILSLLLPFISGCSVHEWPDMHFCLRLDYETEMVKWNNYYDGDEIYDLGLGETYDNSQAYGTIRYIVRVFPANEEGVLSSNNHIKEFVYSQPLQDGYDFESMIDLPGGNYCIMVWSDLVPMGNNPYFYDATNFSNITMVGDYEANNDYRDAYRGSRFIHLESDVLDHLPDTLSIAMQRPLGKYEILSTDLQEFIVKEYEYLQNEALTKGESPLIQVDTDDYRVVFYYSGYLPDTYNIAADKPVDARTGVWFESKIGIINENEASLGFDYVFVNGQQTAVTLQVGLYAKDERQVALSNPFNMPLSRGRHTVLKGSFLLQQASGGINIESDFDGDHNIVIE